MFVYWMRISMNRYIKQVSIKKVVIEVSADAKF